MHLLLVCTGTVGIKPTFPGEKSQPQEPPREKALHFTKLALQEEATASRRPASAADVLANPSRQCFPPQSGYTLGSSNATANTVRRNESYTAPRYETFHYHNFLLTATISGSSLPRDTNADKTGKIRVIGSLSNRLLRVFRV